AEGYKRYSLRDEHFEEVSTPPHREPSAASRDDQSHKICKQRPQQATSSLRCEIKCHAEPEEAVCRPDGLQIADPDVEHRRVSIEQLKPGFWKRGGAEPDGFGKSGGNGGADPGRSQRALARSRTDIGSDHGH